MHHETARLDVQLLILPFPDSSFQHVQFLGCRTLWDRKPDRRIVGKHRLVRDQWSCFASEECASDADHH